MATKWDYKTVVMTGGSWAGTRIRASARPPRAAVRPARGRRLGAGLGYSWNSLSTVRRTGYVVIFKRPLPAGSAPAMASESPTAVSRPGGFASRAS